MKTRSKKSAWEITENFPFCLKPLPTLYPAPNAGDNGPHCQILTLDRRQVATGSVLVDWGLRTSEYCPGRYREPTVDR